jgi:ABC-type nickel/cobalt efflux system permease component RcnA
LIRAAGLTPCPSGTIVLLFALANGVFRVDLEACLVMAVGMGPTVSVVGVIAIVVRRGVVHPLRARPRATRWVSQGVAVAGGAPPPSSVASSPSAWGRGSREGRR